MEGLSSTLILSNLQQDLVALLDKRLVNIDRLVNELQVRVTDLRQLLDRNRRNEQSRKAVRDAASHQVQTQLGSVITIDGSQYAVTEEFKNAIFAVADEVDLDELEAASLCIDVQNELDIVDDSLPYRAIIEFHRRRQILLDCVRLILSRIAEADKLDDEHDLAHVWEYCEEQIVQVKAGHAKAFWKRCLDGLTECEELTTKTRDQLQAIVMTGQALRSDHGETLQVQRMFLAQQHESLSGIMCYLTRAKHVDVHDYRQLLNKAAKASVPMDLISHYAAPIIAGATYFGAGVTSVEDSQALDLHRFITAGPTQTHWQCAELKAAVGLWWLVEYSSRHTDSLLESRSVGSEDDTSSRRDLFFECLKQNGLHFMIAMADYFKPEVWHDPTRADLVGFLLEGTIKFPADSVNRSQWFAQLTMEEFQNFTEALISHMPDVLRQLRSTEDNERRNMLRPGKPGNELHLERFLLVAAYAYQDDIDAATEFWSDSESNLYGFLRWSSRRLTTPRVAAFCELMRALANDERTADHAHRFLLEDVSALGPRVRKSYSVSWALIFNELDLYATSIHNKPALSSAAPASQGTLSDPDIIEQETAIMLEAYLRLAAHVISNSQQARDWVLREQTFRLHEIVLKLAQSSTTPKVQAGCFTVLAALVTGKTIDVSDGLWSALDSWLCGTSQDSSRPQAAIAQPSAKQYFQRIGANVETATAFIYLLNSLIEPAPGSTDLTLDLLPFPEQLGSSQRRNGIDVYVDFVLNEAFLSTADVGLAVDRRQISMLHHACLHFAQLCLSTFNEDLILLHRNKHNLGNAAALLKPFETYARLHPFARTIEYLFNDRVSALLLNIAQQNFDELQTLPDESPLVQASIKAVEVIDLALNLQTAYFDVVRPAIKMQATIRGTSVANPAISSFEDILLMHLPLTTYLITYITSDRHGLAFSSIRLLRQMSRSRRLTGLSSTAGGVQDPQRLISQLAERSESVQVVLRQNFDFTEQQLEEGPDSVMFEKAKAILELLQEIVNVVPDRPNIAHCLLGFQCNQSIVSVEPDSLFAEGKSLFHAIAAAAVSFPASFDDNFQSWLVPVRSGCVQLISSLASATLTRSIVLDELRDMEFLAALQATTKMTTNDSLWDGISTQDPRFCHDTSALALRSLMQDRESSFDLAIRELQEVSTSGVASARAKVVSILSPAPSEGLPTHTASTTLPALIDFFDLDIEMPCTIDAMKYFADVSVDQFVSSDARIDMKLLNQVLVLKKRQLWTSGKIKDQSEEVSINDEMAGFLSCSEAQNALADITTARLTALESWTDLVASLVDFTTDKDFALKALQAVVPRLELSLIRGDLDAAELFAKLALVLVRVIGKHTLHAKTGVTRGSQDSLLQIFRSCIRATTDSNTGPGLRDICYRMGCTIISVFTDGNKESSTSPRRQLSQQLQEMSDRVVRVLAEDAFSDRGVTRVSAVLFLDSVLKLSAESKMSTSVLRALDRINFVPVLIDTSIGSVANTFRRADTELTTSLAYFHTAAAFLLRLAQSSEGPQLILRSDFIAAVEDSGLFSTDPDIGLDIDNPAALQAFYRLLSAIVRILVAVVVGRGPGDGSVMQTTRRFLTDNRNSVAAIFKLASKRITLQAGDNTDALDVANELSRLMLVTDFIEEDEHVAKGATNGYGFS